MPRQNAERKSREGVRRRARQRARLLSRLRLAAGKPVSFTELRQAGIAFPARLATELAVEGVPLERYCRGSGEARRVIGVRLDPVRDPAAAIREFRRGQSEARAGSLSGLRRRDARGNPPARARWLAALGLAGAAAAIAVFLVLPVLAGAGSGSDRMAPRSSSSGLMGGAAQLPRKPAGSPLALPVSESLAVRLETRAGRLLAAGRSGEAASLSRQALQASGERLASCVQPQGAACTTFARALLMLGRALRGEGNATAAVLVLERRLQIKTQRPAVTEELRRALGEARINRQEVSDGSSG